MKSEKSIVRLILILLAVLVAAGVLYTVLSDRFAPTTITPVSDAAGSVDPEELPDAVDFEMEDAAGNVIRLSDFIGEKPVIVNFWASWCPPCRAELPDFDKAYQEYGDQIHFLMVNLTDGVQETKATAQALIDSEGFTFPVYFDTMGQASAGYSLYSIPVTIAISADGKLLSHQVGALSEAAVNQLVQSLLNP